MMSVLSKVAGDIERVLAEDMAAIEKPIDKLGVFVDVCFDIVRDTKEYYQVNDDFWTQINQKIKSDRLLLNTTKNLEKQLRRLLRPGKASVHLKM